MDFLKLKNSKMYKQQQKQPYVENVQQYQKNPK